MPVAELIAKFEQIAAEYSQKSNLQLFLEIIADIRGIAKCNALLRDNAENLDILYDGVAKSGKFGGKHVELQTMKELLCMFGCYIAQHIHPHSNVYFEDSEPAEEDTASTPIYYKQPNGRATILVTNENIERLAALADQAVESLNADIDSGAITRLVFDVSTCNGGSLNLLQYLRALFPPSTPVGLYSFTEGWLGEEKDCYVYWNDCGYVRCPEIAPRLSNVAPRIPVDVLIGSETASVCEMLALCLQGRSGVRIIGVDAAGNYGAKIKTLGMMQQLYRYTHKSYPVAFSFPAGYCANFAGGLWYDQCIRSDNFYMNPN